MFADVIVDITATEVDRIFEYSFIDDTIKTGSRVLVPFGGKKICGIVVLVKDTSVYPPEKIKPIISKTIKQYEAVYEIFYDAFNDFTKNSSNVFFSGKTNILKQPEYDNIDEIKRIVNKLEDESLVRKIEETGEGINVYIGEENEFDPNVTVIKSKYKINGEEGTIPYV